MKTTALVFNALNNVVELNSSAVKLMQSSEGSYTIRNEGSRRLVVEGLRQLKQICSQVEEINVVVTDNEEEQVSPADGGIIMAGRQTLYVQMLYTNNGQLMETSQDIFNGLFLLDFPQKISTVASVLLFNLGVIHHTIGLRHGLSHHVKTALQFYKKSIAILQQQDFEDIGLEYSCLNFLIAALLTNTAHSYKYFYETKHASLVFQHLASQVDAMDANIPHEAKAFFERTLLYNLGLDCCEASPAA